MFSGTCFTSFSVQGESELPPFDLHDDFLCRCTFEVKIPISIVNKEEETSAGVITAHVELGEPSSIGGLDKEDIKLDLEFNSWKIKSYGDSGWFEDELLEIQQQLPRGIYMKSCINCLYSDYSPFGYSSFGDMMCFRNIKDEYLKVKSKDDFWGVHDKFERKVQETYLCKEFKRRVPGKGYRG